MPRVAADALEDDRDGLILTIIDLRGYADAKRRWDAASTAKDKPSGPEIDQVIEIEMELVREALDAKRGTS